MSDTKRYFFKGNIEDIKPLDDKFKKIENPIHLYDILCDLWDIDTCAPRLRDEYKNSHKSKGQCSITAFLAQDIFSGEVLGIELPDGNYHCFNKVGDKVFDLTSEQFLDSLDYTKCVVQSREKHFEKEEKKERYLLLKERLLSYLDNLE